MFRTCILLALFFYTLSSFGYGVSCFGYSSNNELHHFFNQIRGIRNIQEFSDRVNYPVKVIFPGGRLTTLHSEERLSDIVSTGFLSFIRNQNFGDMNCSSSGIHLSEVLHINRQNGRLGIHLINLQSLQGW